MTQIVLIFGFLILILSVSLVIKPAALFGILERYSQSAGLQVVAVVARLILGVALVLAAPETKYPSVLLLLGWLMIAAAVAFSLMGRTRFRALLNWALQLTPHYGRLGGLLGVIFGVFLIYAVV